VKCRGELRSQRALIATRICLAGATGRSGAYISQWEIIDYAHDDKADAPSGTAREPSARLGRIRPAELTVPLEQTQGIVAIRKVTSFVGLRRGLDSVLDLG
jgi:hypothetical protein